MELGLSGVAVRIAVRIACGENGEAAGGAGVALVVLTNAEVASRNG